MKKYILSVFSLVLASFALPAQNDVAKDIEKLSLFLNSLNERYVDSVQTSALLEKGMRAMLEELDPHSVYLTPEQYVAATEPLSGNFKGVGIRYQIILDTMTVLEVMKNTPAEKAGVLRGDQFVVVGTDTLAGKKLSSAKMSSLLKNERNTDAPVLIYRNHGAEQIKMVITRENIKVSSVPAYFVVEDDIGYIKFSRFSSTSLSDFRIALDALVEADVKDLILDLRGNSGGYLNVAVRILDEFIEDRKLLVYTEGVHQSRKETYSTSGGRFTKGNVVVLIDEHSASASEVVAGALQDLDRALIMGRRSYGKGLVQRTVEFDDGSAMRMTISRYYTPSGRSIQRPYDEGLKVYKGDIKNRKLSGELYSEDSINVNDELVYYTPSKRKVYGGGGIVPDVFVPADTAKTSDVLRNLAKSGLHVRVALEYVQRNSGKLSAFNSIEAYTKSFQVEPSALDQVRLLSAKRGEVISDEDFAQSKPELERVMKVLIARFYFGYDSHYYVLAADDAMIQKAIADMQNNTFKELGLK